MDDKQAELWQKAAIANRDRADVADAAYTDAENRYEAERARADRLAAALREYMSEHDSDWPEDGECECDLCNGARAALADSPKEENDVG